ncbi:MAG: hypothetical protein ACI9JL_004371 [Paracoccaceae bacterium]
MLEEFRRGDVQFFDLDQSLSMEGSEASPGPGGIVRQLVENMYY